MSYFAICLVTTITFFTVLMVEIFSQHFNTVDYFQGYRNISTRSNRASVWGWFTCWRSLRVLQPLHWRYMSIQNWSLMFFFCSLCFGLNLISHVLCSLVYNLYSAVYSQGFLQLKLNRISLTCNTCKRRVW